MRLERKKVLRKIKQAKKESETEISSSSKEKNGIYLSHLLICTVYNLLSTVKGQYAEVCLRLLRESDVMTDMSTIARIY